jgi:hypothetical protein
MLGQCILSSYPSNSIYYYYYYKKYEVCIHTIQHLFTPLLHSHNVHAFVFLSSRLALVILAHYHTEQ